MLLFALAAVGSATSNQDEHRPQTFPIGGASSSNGLPGPARFGRAATMPVDGQAAQTPFTNNNLNEPLLHGADHFGAVPSEHDVHNYAETGMNRLMGAEEDERQSVNPVCRLLIAAADGVVNFFTNLPPFDPPVAKKLEKWGFERASNFVLFARPLSKTFYGGKQTCALIGLLHSCAHIIQKASHPAWVETCMADDSYFHWINDPSRRHICSISVDVAPVAMWMIFSWKAARDNGGRYIFPAFGKWCDWSMEQKTLNYLKDERKDIREQTTRRMQMTYTDNTAYCLNKMNDPLALLNVLRNAECEHAEDVLDEAIADANRRGLTGPAVPVNAGCLRRFVARRCVCRGRLERKQARDRCIEEYMKKNYKPKHEQVFAAIARAALAELQRNEQEQMPAQAEGDDDGADMAREALRKKLAEVDRQLKERQQSFQEAVPTRSASRRLARARPLALADVENADIEAAVGAPAA